MAIGHSSGNSDQAKKLLGGMRALRRGIQNPKSKAQNALDQVAAFADQEVALGNASQNPESKIRNRAGGVGFGVREKPSYDSSSIRPNLPVLRPDPNSES